MHKTYRPKTPTARAMCPLIGVCLVALLAATLGLHWRDAAAAEMQTITYTASDANFPNPERGFHDNADLLSETDLTWVAERGYTLVRAYIRLDDYRDQPLPADLLADLERGFDAARVAGIKVIPRFSYNFGIDEPDASREQVLAHIEQLGPVLEQHHDVIAVMQAGFIGAWGEWHSSTNDLDSPENKAAILAALFDEVPATRMVQLRYPGDLLDNYPDALTAADAFGGSDQARTAHHNDCFLANEHDAGTYLPEERGEEFKSYLDTMTPFVAVGGETCQVSPERARTDCSTALAEMERFHWSYLNDFFYEPAMDQWKAEGCYAEIQQRLGYRFRLIEATVPVQAARGEDVTITIDMANDGWARPYNPRDLELVLRNTTTDEVTRLPTGTGDARLFLPGPGETETLSLTAQIPGSLTEGSYDLLLNLPDPLDSLNERPVYSIRLANQDVWETETGYNSLNATIEVQGETQETPPASGAATLYLPVIARQASQNPGPNPSPTPNPQPQDGTTPLGVGLEGLADWAQARMFVDAMKTARTFGSAETPWDGSAPVDADGWPTSDFGVVVMASAQDIGGTYKLSFAGQANVTTVASDASVNNIAYDEAADRTTADVVVEDDAGQLMLAFRNTQGGTTDIKLIRPGYGMDANGDPEQTFSQPFLDLLEPFPVMRMMDFTHTNGNPVAEWSERTLPTSARQTGDKGGAWEYVIELANTTDKDIWINIPHKADDDYVRELATLLNENLDPEIAIYVEYSNEVWNWQFDQATWNLEQAQAEVAAGNSLLDDDGTTNTDYLRWRRVAQRTHQISETFREVYGDAAINTTIRPVLAGQVGWGPSWAPLKQKLDWLERNHGAPGDYLYGLASAPYFNLPKEMRDRTDLTVDEIITALSEEIENLREKTSNYHALARYCNLKSLTYEGGQHLTGEASLEAKEAAQFDPRMGELATTYLTNWYEDGGDLFMWFTLTSGYGKFGFWGLTDNVNNPDTPKYQAILAMRNAERPAVTAGALVPGTLPAQDHLYEDTPDPDAPLSNPQEGTYYDYVIRAESAGTYNLTLNVASTNSDGRLEVLVNSQAMGTVEVPDSGAYDTFVAALPVTLELEEGLNVVRLRVDTAGFSIQDLVIAD